MNADDVKKEIHKFAEPEKGKFLQGFFKTGKGDYAEGDIFLGITVPQSRKIAVVYKDLPIKEIEKLLTSEIHEERLVALFILVLQFKKGDKQTRKEIYDFYVSHTKYINNWDLVDSSADKIVGEYLLMGRDSGVLALARPQNDIAILFKLAKSKDLWERRIAIIATYAFIKKGEYKETLEVAELLLTDKHDLIHKAVGWMLREMGKRCSRDTLDHFLKKHYKEMPRTMLRYAIEHYPESERKKYLAGDVKG